MPTSPADVLLFNPDWRTLPYSGRFRVAVPYFPLELMYIRGHLQRLGIDSVLADMWGQTVTPEALDEMLPQAKIIVVTTAPTYIFWRAGICDVEFPDSVITALRAKAPQAKIVVVGPQGSAMPDLMAQIPFDYLVRGEPDLVAADLAAALLRGDADAAKLDGVCLRRDGALDIVDTTAVVGNLDDLPVLDFEQLRDGHYQQVSYEASRGCPYHCSFCCRSGFRDTFRRKSIERIRTELERLCACGYNHVAMIDELFGVHAGWTDEFCETIRPMGLYWGIQARGELLSRERLEKLIAAGCTSIEVGLESADPAVCAGIGKFTDLDKLKQSILDASQLGLRQLRLFCIFGAPRETPQSIRATQKYLMQFASIPCVEADVFVHMPLPGTKVWHMAREKGYKLDTWADVRRHAGIIENAFTDSQQVRDAVIAFDHKWADARPQSDDPIRPSIFRRGLRFLLGDRR